MNVGLLLCSTEPNYNIATKIGCIAVNILYRQILMIPRG